MTVKLVLETVYDVADRKLAMSKKGEGVRGADLLPSVDFLSYVADRNAMSKTGKSQLEKYKLF